MLDPLVHSTDRPSRLSLAQRPRTSAGSPERQCRHVTADTQFESEKERLFGVVERRRAASEARLQNLHGRREANPLHSPTYKQQQQRALHQDEQQQRSARVAQVTEHAEAKRRTDATVIAHNASKQREDAALWREKKNLQAQVTADNLQLMNQRREAAAQERRRELEQERRLTAQHFDHRWGMSDR